MMNQEADFISSAMLLTLLGGATLGAIAVVLTTTKTGKEFQGKLRSLAGRFGTKAGELNPDEDEVVLAAFI
jgi:gas vesicle protein